MQTPRLELSTEHHAPCHVSIDGTAYPLRGLHDMHIGHIRRHEDLTPRIAELLMVDEPSTEQATELGAALHAAAAIALDAPAEILAALSDSAALLLFKTHTEYIENDLAALRQVLMSRPTGVPTTPPVSAPAA